MENHKRASVIYKKINEKYITCFHCKKKRYASELKKKITLDTNSIQISNDDVIDLSILVFFICNNPNCLYLTKYNEIYTHTIKIRLLDQELINAIEFIYDSFP